MYGLNEPNYLQTYDDRINDITAWIEKLRISSFMGYLPRENGVPNDIVPQKVVPLKSLRKYFQRKPFLI